MADTNKASGTQTEYPLFSVVVLTYMQQHLLFDCLDSILSQTYPNIELIICDDCSADFDEEAIRAYIDAHQGENLRRVVIHRSSRSVGTVQTAQTGVELSTGVYFKLLAGNDMLYAPETLTQAAEMLSLPNVHILAGRSLACQYDGTMTEHYYPSPEAMNCVRNADAATQFDFLGTQAQQMYFHMPAVFFKRSVFDKIGGFDCRYEFVLDWSVLLKVTGAGYAVTTTDNVLATYRYGGRRNSVDAADIPFHNQYYRECIRILKDYALSRFEREGRKKKVFRCHHAIRCLENRIVAEDDWNSWTTGQKLVWRLKNLDFLLLSWLYKKRYQGIPMPNCRKPVCIMLVCILLYLFRVQLLPWFAPEGMWAALFFITALYLLFRVALSLAFYAMRVLLTLIGKRG